MSSELQKAAEAAMPLSERYQREVAGLTRLTAFDEVTLGLSRYSAVTEAAMGLDRWQKNYAELFKPPFDYGELFASDQLIADFRAFEGIDRKLSEVFGALSEVGIGAAGSASAITQALDAIGYCDTISPIDELTRTISGVMDQSVSELSRHALGISAARKAALQCSEIFASGMASHQSVVAEAFASLSQSPLHELAQLASSFDLAEWSEVEDTDEVDGEELRKRILGLLQTILATCNKAANPAGWDAAAWREFAYLAVSILLALNTGYSNDDRARDEDTNQKVSEAKLLAEQATEFLSNLHEAEITNQRYLEYVSSLPRGEVVSVRAYVRGQPKRSAEHIVTLSYETTVAIVGKSGRWWKVVYRDGLTDQLQEGWVGYGSIQLLED